MLSITVPAVELWDEASETFVYHREQVLRLEHSLVSVAKWEAKWNKAFLGKQEKTPEEVLDYIRCMNTTQNVEPEVFDRIGVENAKKIQQYIELPMTATTFGEDRSKARSNEVVTAELIYYWMIALNVPFECQKWHLNRLLTLIQVCNIKNQPPKKHSAREIMSRNAALNAARKKKFNTRG